MREEKWVVSAKRADFQKNRTGIRDRPGDSQTDS